MKRQLLIIAILDTKGREAGYVRNCAIKLGAQPVVMDIGVVGKPLTKPDITNGELANTAGYNLDELIRLHDRPITIKALQEGGSVVANRLLKQNRMTEWTISSHS